MIACSSWQMSHIEPSACGFSATRSCFCASLFAPCTLHTHGSLVNAKILWTRHAPFPPAIPGLRHPKVTQPICRQVRCKIVDKYR